MKHLKKLLKKQRNGPLNWRVFDILWTILIINEDFIYFGTNVREKLRTMAWGESEFSIMM